MLVLKKSPKDSEIIRVSDLKPGTLFRDGKSIFHRVDEHGIEFNGQAVYAININGFGVILNPVSVVAEVYTPGTEFIVQK